MGALAQQNSLSIDEYLAGEENADCRHEYLAGETYAMSGASARHNVICGNLFAALHRHLAGGPCKVFMNDLKVRLSINREDYFYYPDVMVACRSEDRATHYREQPSVLVEVMSASTERVDRREKLFAYRSIDALEEYVLIAQDTMEVVVYCRADGWGARRPVPEAALELPSLDFALPISELYRGTDEV